MQSIPVDPRIHFALVCGAKSCPPIKMYTPDNLEEGLNSAADAVCEGAEASLLVLLLHLPCNKVPQGCLLDEAVPLHVLLAAACGCSKVACMACACLCAELAVISAQPACLLHLMQG